MTIATKADPKNLIRENVSVNHLAQFLTAPSGWTLGVYSDGSVHVGDSVGRELDRSEQPIATAKCPGIGQLDMTYWRSGWDCDHLDAAEVVYDCCENGDVESELTDLVRDLIDSLED